MPGEESPVRLQQGLFRHIDQEEQALRRAASLDPGDAEARRSYSWLLSAAERGDEAVDEILAALQLDPLSVSVRADLAWAYLYADRYADAIEAAT